MRKRRPCYRLVKIHRSYAAEEVARLFDLHKNTVRSWIEAGLPVCDEMRPHLILGRELAAFLQVRRAKKKRPCAPGEMYYLRCRAPRTPAGEIADFMPVTNVLGNLVGICPECFNLSEKETRIATARREQRSPTLEQVKHVIQSMPGDTEIERRNRALLAFVLLTGARDSTIASMKLKHVDLTERSVFQDAREVRTKFSKTFTTFFFPVGDEVAAIFVDWMEYLLKVKLWGREDPLFPATAIAVGESQRFEVVGLDRKPWSNATPIRTVFRRACEAAGLPYFNPHSLRKTLARLGEQKCRTPEEFKAWSQNLGHEQVLTTFTSYGAVRADRQREIICSIGKLGRRSETVDAESILLKVAQMLEKSGADLEQWGSFDA